MRSSPDEAGHEAKAHDEADLSIAVDIQSSVLAGLWQPGCGFR